MTQTVADLYPAFPFQYFLIDKWPSKSRIASVKSPVYIFHGTQDKLITTEQAKALAELAHDGQFIEVPGGEHNDIPMLQLRKLLKRIRVGPDDV